MCPNILGEFVGRSTAIRFALTQVEVVASTDSTVLILGETGTGKELIAKAIHNISPRRNHPFIRADCASIPAGLLESELFGQEKGAFTGAFSREIGRFEAAQGGTIFLDEVGDAPLELQSTLLRVLQEHEVQRLGSNHTIRLDFRLVAATNRDLLRMVDNTGFRRDLYYRLSVFPIHIPAVRERRDDIPLLVRHFLAIYALRMNKQIGIVGPEDMQTLVSYDWPGNVRELQNIIERSIILSSGTVFRLCPLGSTTIEDGCASSVDHTLSGAEREQILRVLRETHWVIGGAHGAAAILGVKRTTLLYKMRRLRISRPEK